jgi:hypothetical protein
MSLGLLTLGVAGLLLALPRTDLSAQYPRAKPAAVTPADTGSESLDAVLREPFSKAVQPLLVKYCNECHGGESAKADIRFDREFLDAELVKQRDEWERIIEVLESGSMPPKEKPQPEMSERHRMTTWVQHRVLKSDCTGPRDPGRVTIRRLNRVEYNNTIRDLVGVDFQPADDFPADDIGYGFDHIGDVLSLPPILLEKYLSAAERISEAAIVSTSPDTADRKLFNGENGLLSGTNGGKHESGWVLSSNGDCNAETQIETGGRYLLWVRAVQTPAGNEPARMDIKLNGKPVSPKHVKLEVRKRRFSTPQVFECQLKLEPGKHTFTASFLNDFYDPENKDETKRDRNLVIHSIELVGPLDVPLPDDKLPETHKRVMFERPKSNNRRDVATRIMERFASRAFRRPAKPDEVNRLADIVMSAVDSGDGFEKGVQVAMQAVLCSPHFLFRVERDPNPKEHPDGVRSLDDFEIATRLSYFLWSSMPDDELFELARNGSLKRPARLAEQVRRMLKNPKSDALVANFAGQWLQLRNIAAVSFDPKLFPELDSKLREDMRTETEMFFSSIVREDRSVLTFLDSDFTFLNERLAKHYGVPDVAGPEFRKVYVDKQQRGGLLGQASMLTVTSNPTRTSPVKRGQWILENLLASPAPPPPPGVPDLDGEKEGGPLTGTLRQKMEQHRDNPNCAICHQKLDPLGFGLENYNALGAWRTEDAGLPIDPSGVLPNGQSFGSVAELRAVLLTRGDDFRECLAEKLLTYALGRGLEYYDQCTVEELVAALRSNGDRFSVLVLEIVKSDAFQKRRKAQ